MYILKASWSDKLQGYHSHYHDAHELLYICSGEIAVTVNGRLLHAGAGTLLIFSRFEEHSIRVLSNRYQRYTLLIAPEISGSGENYLLSSVLVNRSAGFDHIVNCLSCEKKMSDIFAQMYLEYQQKNPLYETVLDAMLIHLLCQLYRLEPGYFSSGDRRDTEIVHHLQGRFERCYAQRFVLSELAETYHVSVSHLSHSFKKITGYSPMRYLCSCRISAAKKLLVDSDKNIGQIVDLCGFSDESNFSRTFRKITGMTPTDFRRTNGA